MADNFDWTELETELIVDEGKRLKPYKDTHGNVSIGIGRNLSGVGISEKECQDMFVDDCISAISALDTYINWWRSSPPNVQRVLINLCFNMGWQKFSAFHQFLQLVQAGDYEAAANDLQSTTWWSQVGGRGPRMVNRLLAGNKVA